MKWIAQSRGCFLDCIRALYICYILLLFFCLDNNVAGFLQQTPGSIIAGINKTGGSCLHTSTCGICTWNTSRRCFYFIIIKTQCGRKETKNVNTLFSQCTLKSQPRYFFLNPKVAAVKTPSVGDAVRYLLHS